jgi:hypothetical protein
VSWEAMFAAVAVVVSLAASWVALRAHREALAQGTFADVYDEFNKLSELRLQHWELSHMQEVPENYDAAVSVLSVALEDMSNSQRHQLLVQERAVAIRIFSLFEHACYQCRHAHSNRDGNRAEFLDEVLAYFTGRLLQNPRLRYFWMSDGGNLRVYYEPETIERYERALAGASQDGVDRLGPFGGPDHVQVADQAS